MAKKEIYTKTKYEDLIAKRAETNEALRTFRFHISGSRAKHTSRASELRKTIARITTELHARQKAENK
jgi:ribosomal protein L29